MSPKERTTRVGFIGLGVMGKPMAINVMAVGFPLAVFTSSPASAEAFARRGASVAASCKALAAASDVVVIMVPDTADLQDVITRSEGVREGAHSKLAVVAMGTYEPSAMVQLQTLLRRVKVSFLDAPVSGGEVAARSSDLSIMVGGDVGAFRMVRPVLESMGAQVTHIGPSGAGQIAKACNQLIVGTTIQAVAEALSLAEAAGVDPAKVRAAMMGGFAASRALELHGQRMLDRDFRPGGKARLHAKDARIVLAIAARVGLRVPRFEPVAAALQQLVDQGYGDQDHAALIELVRASGRGSSA